MGFRDAIEKGVVDIYQPDVLHAGGITEARKMATLADVYYAAIALHNPLGPLVVATSLQLDASIGSSLCQEVVRDAAAKYVKSWPYAVDGGHMSIPPGMGLGVDVDEEDVAEAECLADRHLPVVSHGDGPVAAW